VTAAIFTILLGITAYLVYCCYMEKEEIERDREGEREREEWGNKKTTTACT
jgi:hypothetical protein